MIQERNIPNPGDTMMAEPNALLEIFAEALKNTPPPTLRELTAQRAARLESTHGRLPATWYGWGEDTEEQLEEEEGTPEKEPQP